MNWQKRKVPRITKYEFFDRNAVNCTREFLAEKAYELIHTYYLKDKVNIKSEMGVSWRNFFGIYMDEETFIYMKTNEPGLLRYDRIEEIKQGKEIVEENGFCLCKTIVALEFDLWLMEQNQNGQVLELEKFEWYLHKKYGQYLDRAYGFFKSLDLWQIQDFQGLALKLEPYYEKILVYFNALIDGNKKKIERIDDSVKRVNRIFGENKEEKEEISETEELQKGNLETTELQTESLEGVTSEKKSLNSNQEREYQIILSEKEERIKSLENDIKEFKHQTEKVVNYSVEQYDKGRKDLFCSLNDIKYGKIIDYFYRLLKTEGTDEVLASYLDNFFIALEDMGIEAIIQEDKFVIQEESLIKDYNLDFNKADYDASKVELKYVGWKYKGSPMEKPMLTLKEKKSYVLGN